MVKFQYYRRNKVRRPLALAIVTGILGALILTAALVSLNRTREFLSGAQALEARVVAMQVDRSGKEDRFRPTFAFTDRAGQEHRLPAWRSAPEYGFAKGAGVAVLFNPDFADHVRIDSWEDTWKPGLKILFVAGVFLLMALGGLVLHRRWMRERPEYVARDDWVPEDSEGIIYFNVDGRVRFLRHPKVAAIALAVPGLGFLAAGLYGVRSGTDMGGDGQATAFLVGAAVLLGLALRAALLHRKYQRARARRRQDGA